MFHLVQDSGGSTSVRLSPLSLVFFEVGGGSGVKSSVNYRASDMDFGPAALPEEARISVIKTGRADHTRPIMRQGSATAVNKSSFRSARPHNRRISG